MRHEPEEAFGFSIFQPGLKTNMAVRCPRAVRKEGPQEACGPRRGKRGKGLWEARGNLRPCPVSCHSVEPSPRGKPGKPDTESQLSDPNQVPIFN